MMKSKRSIAYCVLGFALLAGCTTSLPQGKYMPAQTFENLQPLSINVKSKTVNAAPERNEAGATFPFDLSEMAQIYLNRKINPVGAQNTLSAHVDEAVISDVYQKSDSKAIGWLGMGGFDVYEIRLKIRLEHRADNGDMLYGNVVNAQRQIKISQHKSMAEREQDQFEALEKLFLELDQRIDMILMEKMRLKPM